LAIARKKPEHRGKAAAGSLAGRRLNLEELETRLAPAGLTYDYTGNGGNNLASNPANYVVNGKVPNQMPGNGDLIVLDGQHGANSNNPITFDAAFTSTPASITVAASYGGSVTVATNLNVIQFAQTGMVTVNAGDTLTANTWTFTGGFLSGGGAVNIVDTQGNAAFNIQGSLQAQISVNALDIDAGAALNISAPVNFTGAEVDNFGAATWTGGAISMGNTTTFLNSGSFTIQCDTTLSGGTFNNNGSLTKNTTNGITSITTTFNNSTNGSVLVATGTLNLQGAGTDSAPFTVDTGAVLLFQGAGASVTLNNGAAFNGQGSTTIDAGATVASSANVTFASPLYLSGNNSLLSGTFTADNSFDWSAGTIIGDFTANGTVDLNTAGTKTLRGFGMFTSTFTNNANLTFQDAGNLALTQGNFVNNGVFDIQNDVNIQNFGGSSFINNGTVKKTQGAPGGKTTFNMAFTNDGALNLGSFTIVFQTGLTQGGTGSSTYLAGGTLQLGGGLDFTMNQGLLSGWGTVAGSLDVAGGSVEVGTNQDELGLTVTGDYSEGLRGALESDAWANNEFGLLTVGGTAQLGGTLLINIEPVYNPANGDTGTVVSDNNGFGGTQFLTPPAPWTTAYGANAVTVTW
jgi:hypothetical protein